jgi:hypothetical protein
VSALDSWTGLPNLSVDVGVDRLGERKKLGKIIPLPCRRLRIASAARKTKPQRSYALPAKPNSTVEHRRRANPRPRRTRSTKRWIPPPRLRPSETWRRRQRVGTRAGRCARVAREPMRGTVRDLFFMPSYIIHLTLSCSFGWWLVLICSERKVLMVGCWLVLREKTTGWWLTGQTNTV